MHIHRQDQHSKMDDNTEDQCSTCSSSSLGSIDDLNPNTLDLTTGDYSVINTQLFSVLAYNINSITASSKKDQLESMAHELNLDIIALTETKLCDAVQESVYTIPGYSIINKNRDRRGGGVMLYIRDDHAFTRIEKIEMKEHISIDCIVNNKKINVNVIYRPPSRTTATQTSKEEDDKFLRDITTTLNKIRSHRASTKIICGDLNFGDVYNFHGGLNGKSLDNTAAPLFLEKGFVELIDIPTRKVGMSTSLIDLIFVNKTDDVVLTATTPPIADHCGTLISMNTLTFKKPPKKFIKYDYDTANWEGIEATLQPLNNKFQYDDSIELSQEAVDKMAAEFCETLIKIRDDHVPHKSVTIYEKDKPWLDNTTRRKLTKKNRAFKVYSKAIDQIKKNNTQTTAANEKIKKLFDKYKEKKKDFEYTARKSKQTYFNGLKKILSNPDVPSKKKFTMLNRLTNTGKDANIPPIIDNDQVINDPLKKAQIFNKFFASKSKIQGRHDTPPKLDTIHTNSDLSDITTSHHEIGPFIKSMKTADFSPCGIPSKFLKLLYHRFGSKISRPIANLLNSIFKSGHYPLIWKKSHITPVYKRKGAKTDKKSWRPISILPTISKLCESIVHHRLLAHLIENRIITDRQAAYLPKDSTANQLLYMVHQIKLSWSRKQISHACFLDISSAFDSVWHSALLEKLSQINVTNSPFKLLQSYLSDRSACTVVDGKISDSLPVEAGVPQGSRLGPLLFLVFINDIVTDLESTPQIFADDTTLLTAASDTHETTSILNRDLARIAAWAKKFKVTFNSDKTKEIIFSKQVMNNSLPLIFDGHIADRCGKHKHLGITLTPDLSWDVHINNIIKQVNLKLSMIYSVRQLSRQTLDVMFKMHIRSCIDYCIQVFGNSINETQIAKLDRLQHRAAKITTMAMKFTSKEKLLLDLGWENYKTRIEYLSLCLFHKIHTHETRPQIRECMPPVNNNHTATRSQRYYNNYSTRDAEFNNSFFPKTVRRWNNLPVYLRNLSIDEFKIELAAILKPKKNRLYNIGSKFGNSIHTQLRLNCSQLNSHLYSFGLSLSPNCLCQAQETTKHFMLDCFIFSIERNELFEKLEGVLERKHTDNYSKTELLQILLQGEKPEIYEKYRHNKLIFKYVQDFLFKTKRLVYKSKNQYIPT